MSCWVAAVSVVAILGTANVLRRGAWLRSLFPFVLVAWLLLLASLRVFRASTAARCRPAASCHCLSTRPRRIRFSIADFVQGVLKSVSQVFLKGNGVCALLFLAGLAVSSLAAAVFALVGALVAVAHRASSRRRKRPDHRRPPRLQPGADRRRARRGVLSAELAGRGVRTGWPRCSRSSCKAALNVALTPFAIPALTAPFVLVSWLFLLPRQCFETAPCGRYREAWRDVALMSGEVFLDFNPWGVDARAEGDRGWSRFGQPSAIDMLRQLN